MRNYEKPKAQLCDTSGTLYKTLHFLKIVAVLYGVFAQFLSKTSPFGLFFDKKQQNKDDVPPIKNVTFCENYRCFIRGF